MQHCFPPSLYDVYNAHRSGPELVSRIDLVLANAAALRLVSSVAVQDDIRDGGHCPVLVQLDLTPGIIQWRPPLPRLPPLLQLPSAMLRQSNDWRELLLKWQAHPEVQPALRAGAPHSLDSLSQGLRHALHVLVALAGGWSVRAPVRRLAYDSNAVRKLRRRLDDLRRLGRLCAVPAATHPGSWPLSWMRLLRSLKTLGVPLPTSSVTALRAALIEAERQCTQQLHCQMQRMRQERSVRWRSALPSLWRDRPAVLHHWLEA